MKIETIKQIALLLLSVVGASVLTACSNTENTASSGNDKWITFGRVDFSDDEEEVEEVDEMGADEVDDSLYSSWIEDLVKDNPSPFSFSKTIVTDE